MILREREELGAHSHPICYYVGMNRHFGYLSEGTYENVVIPGMYHGLLEKYSIKQFVHWFGSKDIYLNNKSRYSWFARRLS